MNFFKRSSKTNLQSLNTNTSSTNGNAGNDPNSPDSEKFTLPHLRNLYKTLFDNRVVSKTNEKLVIELLRSIAEMVVYGDNKSELLFDFFCEKNMLSLFLEIMRSPSVCPITVHLQIFQTLSILCQCVKNDTSLYYLLSNNYINEMIMFPFTFEEEELCDNFISFLKSLSLRLNTQTVQFFFIEETGAFPLLTKAIYFLQYRDPMVRTAAQAAILNVFRVSDERAREYSLKEDILVSFVTEVSNLLEAQYNAIVALVSEYHTYAIHPNTRELTEGKVGARIEDKLKSHLACMEDWLYYLQDIFSLHIDVLTGTLVEHLSIHYIYPVLLDPLLRYNQWKFSNLYCPATQMSSLIDPTESYESQKIEILHQPSSDSNCSDASNDDCAVLVVTSLYLLSQILRIIKDKQLKRSLCVAIFHPMNQKQRKTVLTRRKRSLTSSRNHSSNNLAAEEGIEERQSIDNNCKSQQQLMPNPYRIALQQLLNSKIERYSILTAFIIQSFLRLELKALNSCYDNQNQVPSRKAVEFACNLMDLSESLFLWPDDGVPRNLPRESTANIPSEKDSEAKREADIENSYHEDQKNDYHDHDEFDQFDLSRSLTLETDLDKWLEFSTDEMEELSVTDSAKIKNEITNVGNESNSRHSIEAVDIMEQETSSSVKVQLLLRNADALSLTHLHHLKSEVDGMPSYNDLTTYGSSSSLFSHHFLTMQDDFSQHSLVLNQIISICLYDFIRLSHITKYFDGAGASYPKSIGHCMRHFRETGRKLAGSLLSTLSSWIGDTMINLLEEEIRRFMSVKTKWHQTLNQLNDDIVLLLPITPSLQQRLGVDHVVPTSEVEICRREIELFLIFRALFKKSLELFASPLVPTTENDIGKTICDDTISIFAENTSNSSYVVGTQFVIKGKSCIPCCLVHPLIDLAEFSSTGKVKATASEDNKSNNRRSSLSPSKILTNLTSKGSPTPNTSDPPITTPFRPRRTGEIYFVHDDNVILLGLPDKTSLDKGMVLLSLPIHRADVVIDSEDDRNLKVLIKSTVNQPTMDRVADGCSKGGDHESPLVHHSHIPSILPPRQPGILYQLSIGFDSSKLCESVMKQIEGNKQRVRGEKMEQWKAFLTKWADVAKENPES